MSYTTRSPEKINMAYVLQQANLLDVERFPEDIFEKIKAAYSENSRNFHGLNHGFEIAAGTNAIIYRPGTETELVPVAQIILSEGSAAPKYEALRTMIGLGHDLDYYHVDNKSFPEIAKKAMETFLERGTGENAHKFTIKKPEDFVDEKQIQLLEIATTLFGFKSGHVFDGANPFAPGSKGFNEFTSALVMMDLLQKQGMKEKYLAQIAAGIAATVPFVGKRDDGKNHIEVLTERLEQLRSKQPLHLSDQEIQITKLLMADVAIQDVLGFAGEMETDPEAQVEAYLKGSWRLMPEMNAKIRDGHIKPEDYLRSVSGSAGFARGWVDPENNFLDPKNIFHQVTLQSGDSIMRFPDDATYKTMQENLRNVLETAALYQEVKVVSAATVMAFAESAGITEKDLNTLMGGKAENRNAGIGREIQLPIINLGEGNSEKDRLVQTLLRSRESDANTDNFDVSRSPIAELIFTNIPPTTSAAAEGGQQQTREDVIRELAKAAQELLKPDADKKAVSESFLQKLSGTIGPKPLESIRGALETAAKNDPNAVQSLQSLRSQHLQNTTALQIPGRSA